MPQLSVIIPTYNRETTVVEAVVSVLSQSLDDIEVVVVDDGSDDGTVARLDEINDSRLHVVAAPHQGANAARNRGVEEATATLVSFLDSDDVLEPEWAATMVHLLQVADVASCSFIPEQDGTEGNPVAPKPLSPFFPEVVAAFTHGGTYALRRDLFLEIGGLAKDLQSGQHSEFGLRVAKHSQEHAVRFVSISEPLVRYRLGSSGSIRNNWHALAAGSEYLLEAHADLYSKHRRERAAAEYRQGVRWLRAGEPMRGRRAFSASFRARPSVRSAARLVQASVDGTLSNIKARR